MVNLLKWLFTLVSSKLKALTFIVIFVILIISMVLVFTIEMSSLEIPLMIVWVVTGVMFTIIAMLAVALYIAKKVVAKAKSAYSTTPTPTPAPVPAVAQTTSVRPTGKRRRALALWSFMLLALVTIIFILFATGKNLPWETIGDKLEKLAVSVPPHSPVNTLVVELPTDGSFSKPLPLPPIGATLRWSKNVDVLVKIPGGRTVRVNHGETFDEALTREEQQLSFASLETGQYGRVIARWTQ